jgi:hypothetical protein
MKQYIDTTLAQTPDGMNIAIPGLSFPERTQAETSRKKGKSRIQRVSTAIQSGIENVKDKLTEQKSPVQTPQRTEKDWFSGYNELEAYYLKHKKEIDRYADQSDISTFIGHTNQNYIKALEGAALQPPAQRLSSNRWDTQKMHMTDKKEEAGQKEIDLDETQKHFPPPPANEPAPPANEPDRTTPPYFLPSHQPEATQPDQTSIQPAPEPPTEPPIEPPKDPEKKEEEVKNVATTQPEPPVAAPTPQPDPAVKKTTRKREPIILGQTADPKPQPPARKDAKYWANLANRYNPELRKAGIAIAAIVIGVAGVFGAREILKQDNLLDRTAEVAPPKPKTADKAPPPQITPVAPTIKAPTPQPTARATAPVQTAPAPVAVAPLAPTPQPTPRATAPVQTAPAPVAVAPLAPTPQPTARATAPAQTAPAPVAVAPVAPAPAPVTPAPVAKTPSTATTAQIAPEDVPVAVQVPPTILSYQAAQETSTKIAGNIDTIQTDLNSLKEHVEVEYQQADGSSVLHVGPAPEKQYVIQINQDGEIKTETGTFHEAAKWYLQTAQQLNNSYNSNTGCLPGAPHSAPRSTQCETSTVWTDYNAKGVENFAAMAQLSADQEKQHKAEFIKTEAGEKPFASHIRNSRDIVQKISDPEAKAKYQKDIDNLEAHMTYIKKNYGQPKDSEDQSQADKRIEQSGRAQVLAERAKNLHKKIEAYVNGAAIS